jgi:CRP/FNR family transcriptional regulator
LHPAPRNPTNPMLASSIPLKDPDLLAELERTGQWREAQAGMVLMHPGGPITHIPIVEKGALRVLLQGRDGAERYLYHVLPGESCAMSLLCCNGRRPSEVKAVVEEDARLLMVPVSQLTSLGKYPEWAGYISEMQSQRFGELLEALELTAFSRLDEQLWDYLVKRVQATGRNGLKVTHQQVADELGSPREVITRLLHQLQQRGRVKLGRNTIEVIPAVV